MCDLYLVTAFGAVLIRIDLPVSDSAVLVLAQF